MKDEHLATTNDDASDDDLFLMHLLEGADPYDESSLEPACERQKTAWTQLLNERHRHRKFASYGALAIAAATLLAIGVFRERERNVPLAEKTAEFDIEDSVAAVSSQDLREPSSKELPSGEAAPKEIAVANAASSRDSLLGKFCEALERVDRNQAGDWVSLVSGIRSLPVGSQRELVFGISQIEDPLKLNLAAAAILDAADGSAPLVLEKWFAVPKMRMVAWKLSVEHSSVSTLMTLSVQAKSQEERIVLCNGLARNWREGGVAALVNLSKLKAWRWAVGSAAINLPPQSHRILLSIIDSDAQSRAAAGFVLQSIPAESIDYELAEMIVSGRRRMAGYQALLSRNTKQARQFLAISASRADLSPALAAAWRRWNQWGPQTSQWVSEIRSIEDEDDNAWQNSHGGSRYAVAQHQWHLAKRS